MENNHLNYTGGIYDTELENYLEAEHQKLLEKARIKGKHFAKQNRPEPRGDSLDSYVGDLVAGHERLIAHANQKLQHESSKAEAQMLIASAEEKTKERTDKRKVIQAEMQNFELEKSESGESMHQMKSVEPVKGFSIILLIIGLTEVAINVGALQLLGGNWLSALVMSVGITGALFLLAKQLAKYLKESSHDGMKKKLVTIGATLLALGVFYMLASLRAEQLKDKAHYDLHPIWLVFLNLVFYVVTVWYIYKNTIPSSEKDEHDKNLREKEHYENLKQQDAELDTEIKAIKDELSQKLNMLLYKPEYAKRLIERIRRWSAECVEVFKSTNLTHRHDRRTPDCFLYNRNNPYSINP